MLRQLHISNLAVIEDVTVELTPGLNCFTGATGAGKSLVIGAFELLLGLRSATDLLRPGAEEGRVSGVFELNDPETISQVASLADLPPGDLVGPSAQLLITRKLFGSGRTSVSINGQPATAAMLRSVGELLVDVHGQHDHQYLLKPAHQLVLLDRFGGCEALRERYAEASRRRRELEDRRRELGASADLRRQQLELYEFQAEEIDAVEPVEGEYAELSARGKLLENLQRVSSDAGSAYAALYEADGSVSERLQAVVGVLRELAELDAALAPVAEAVAAAGAQVHDAAYDLGRYLNRLEIDPAESGEVTDRLNALNRLIHKYSASSPRAGGTIADVLRHRAQIGAEIARLRHEGVDLETIDAQIAPMREQMQRLGAELSSRRRAAADRLAPQVIEQLADLGMGEARFEVAVEPLNGEAAGESATGHDAIEMMVQPNPGQPLRPLRKIASGGEMSRIMLAIKGILAEADRVSVLVFDEIDANIGGRLGAVTGAKLRALAAAHQVLCITHLPQIASWADHHLKISKRVDDGQTRTRVEPLSDRARRVDELAEMLSGKDATATTRRQAEEMLALAEAGHVMRASKAAPAKREAPKRGSGATVTAKNFRRKGTKI